MRPDSLDVYLFPAVVGGGLGDIEEVLAAARHLARSGHRLFLYRDRPLPAHVDGPWRWPAVERTSRISRHFRRALTLSAGWGVACAPARSEPYGKAGAWADEAAAVETAYGSSAVLHVSLEEFARTLTSRAQTAERWREGGIATREIRRRLARAGARRDVRVFHREYRKFRAFDRNNVLHIFAGFSPSRAFASEFPEAVQTGPLGADPGRRRSWVPGIRRTRGPLHWFWYASPASSARMIGPINAGLSGLRRSVTIDFRSARPVPLPSGGSVRWRVLPELNPKAWAARFRRADLRIVTGSRTLLEALEMGGPFLYFNGVTGSGRRMRRHRPEKIAALLRLWRSAGVDSALCRDLASFSGGRNLAPILRRAATGSFDRRFPIGTVATGFRAPYRSVNELLDAVADLHTQATVPSEEIVRRARTGEL